MNLQVSLPAVHTLTSFRYFIKTSSFSLFIDGHIGGGGVIGVGVAALHEVGEVIPGVGGAVEMEVGEVSPGVGGAVIQDGG